LEGRALLSELARGGAPSRFLEIDRIDLMPLNGSGVTGHATLREIFLLGPGSDPTNARYIATLRLSVTGLEAGQSHAQDIDGTTYLGPPAVCPPASAAGNDPSPAGLGDEIISAGEASAYTGMVNAQLKDIPASRSAGSRNLRLVFRGRDDFLRGGLLSIYMVRGLTVQGQYQPTVPVACGQLTAIGTRRI
jgi:hypothetical protein